MNNKENKSSSNLIKSIYKSYVDLKTGDLHDLDYDILLENIKSLYLDVKAMRVHPFDLLDENHSISQSTTSSAPSNIIATNSPILIEDIQEKPLEEIETEKTEPLNEEELRKIESFESQETLGILNSSEPIELESSVMETEPVQENETLEADVTTDSETLNEPIEVQETEEVQEVEAFNNDMAESKEIEADILEEKSDDIEDDGLEEITSKEEENHEDEDDKIDNNLPIIEKNLTENLSEDPSSNEDAQEESKSENPEDEVLEFELNEKSIKEKNSNNIVSFLKEDTTNNNYKPVGDLIDMIDINTRIGLVEIFFKGDSLSLSESLSVLNKTDDRNKSIQIIDKLAEKYDIGQEDDIYGTFINLIDRKFGVNS